jgi:signal transduction histidine kinase/HAMP domain-containing protein
MINPLRDRKVRTKISFLVALTLVLIGVVVGFGLRQISVIGKEMSAVVEGDIPLLKALSRITFHKLKQTIHLEEAIRLGKRMGAEGALRRDFEAARESFFDHDRLVTRELEQDRLRIKRVYAKYRGSEMEGALLQIDYELRSVQKEIADYQFRAERVFNLLAQGKLKEAEPTIEEILRARESDEDRSREHYGALENLLALIENFVNDSVLQAKRSERNAMIGMASISALVLLLSLGLGMVISRSITKPLHVAVTIANRIAAGDRAITIDAISRDETGQLLEALKSMSCAIREGEASLKRRAEELAEAREESLKMMENIQVARLRAEQANESLSQEIVERKQAEKELWKTKDHLGNVIESSVDCILIGDSAGILTRVNKAFLELLGREEEEVIGKQTAELSVTEEGTYESTTGELVEIDGKFFDGLKTMLERLYVDGKVSNWETYFLRKDKKVVPVEMSIVFLYDSEGVINGAVGINRDITERKKMEMELKEATVQLVQSEKLSALGELTAGVAHELNQPLNGIKIISQSLLNDIKRGQLEEEELGKDLNDVVNQVNKMAEIIDHMRIFTRRTEGAPTEIIVVNSIVEEAFKFLGQQLRNHNIEVHEDLGSDLPKITGDPIRLEQVFLNLVSNARNAMEGGGKEKKVIEIRTYADNTNGDSSVVIEVKDNGGGVPEHVREKIFQPFFTTNAPGKGTGLGLSVSSKIIEEHRGRIELDSVVGEGATFRVILPALEQRA